MSEAFSGVKADASQIHSFRVDLLKEASDDAALMIDSAVNRIKVWIFSAALSIVLTFGGSAVTFWFTAQGSFETARDNRAELDKNRGFQILTRAQIVQLQEEAEKGNPDFDPVVTIYTGE